MLMNVESIGNPICHLAECPIWNDEQKSLFWTDILEKRLWRYSVSDGTVQKVWEGDLMVGGFAFTVGGEVILCTDKGVYRLPSFSSQPKRLFDIAMADDERFNDITVDPRGRIFAGTLTSRRDGGTLYRLEKHESPKPVLRDVGVSNGMTFSLDLRYFYHADSEAGTITRYDYDVRTGDIESPHVIYRTRPGNGVPDGITLDMTGHLWVACWGGGKIIRIDDDGRIVGEVPVPAVQPSSVMFGGDEMTELFITSACEGGVDLKRGLDGQGRYLGGEVFHVHVDVAGRKEWLADF